MRRRFMSIMLSAVMAAGVLAGCAGGASTAATTAAGASTEGETAGGGDGLVYWTMWEATEPQGQAIQMAIDKFTADTGVKVDVQF